MGIMDYVPDAGNFDGLAAASTIFLIVGTALFIMGLFFFLPVAGKNRTRSRGVVVGTCINPLVYNKSGEDAVIDLGRRYPGRCYRAPVVEYRVGGTLYKKSCAICYSAWIAESMIGKEVNVWYDEDNPGWPSLSRAGARVLIGLSYIGYGFCAFLFGLVISSF